MIHCIFQSLSLKSIMLHFLPDLLSFLSYFLNKDSFCFSSKNWNLIHRINVNSKLINSKRRQFKLFQDSQDKNVFLCEATCTSADSFLNVEGISHQDVNEKKGLENNLMVCVLLHTAS